MDGNELEAYFPTKSEPLDLNNLNELDVNENSAGGGTHISFVHDAHISPDGSKKKKEFPTTLSWNAPKEVIKDFIEKAKAANKEVKYEADDTPSSAAAYDYPLDKAFDYGYNVDVDPLNKLFKMVSNDFSPNKIKVKIDDTIPADLLETEDLKLGRLYRVAGVDLVVRFVGQIMIPVEKTLLQIKHHATVLYVEEKQLVRASSEDVEEYLMQ